MIRKSPAAPFGVAGRLVLFLFIATTIACTGPQGPTVAPPAVPPGAIASAQVVLARPGVECVPYARRESRIALSGDAWSWWERAKGRYGRGAAPQPGALLVFKRHNGSPGHLAVVRRVIGPRLIAVDHADWLNDGNIHVATPVADVSPNGDWSQLRVWYSPGIAWGVRVYGAYGFIYPDRTVAARMTPLQDGG